MSNDASTAQRKQPTGAPAAPIIEGRCIQCWGEAFLSDTSDEITGLECRLCSNHLKGEEAANEWASLKQEAERNILASSLGKAATYRSNAKFLAKIIPDMHRDKVRWENQMKAARMLPRRVNKIPWITRHDVPAGNAGFLYLQAKLLAAGARTLPQEMAIHRWDEIALTQPLACRIENLGKSGANIKIKAVGSPRTSSGAWEERAGAIMMRTMSAAFSCEVALKAILMTRHHRARKTHDLLDLYDDLPDDSRARMKGDYPAIRDVFKNSRQTFDKWRYFESAISKEAAERTLHHERTKDLEKAARVIIDECAVAGLKGELRMTVSGSWAAKLEKTAPLETSQESIHFEAESGESAIVWPSDAR